MNTPDLSVKAFRSFAVLAAGVVTTGAALAHHPLDGAMPVTAMQGLLSGLAHPVIGMDHLLFLLAAATLLGLSRASTGQSAMALALITGASLIGTALRLPGAALPMLELLIGASLLAAAACLWRRRSLGFGPVLLMAAGAGGFLHGQVYGEVVIGAEAAPVAAYLLGLLTVQCGLLMAVFLMVRRASSVRAPRVRLGARLLGAAVAAAGAGSIGLALLA